MENIPRYVNWTNAPNTAVDGYIRMACYDGDASITVNLDAFPIIDHVYP